MSYMKRTTFTISLSPDVFSRLTAAAWQLDVSKGAVVRMALQDWFSRHDQDSKELSLRTNLTATPAKREDFLKISPLPIAIQRRKRNRIELPADPTGPKS